MGQWDATGDRSEFGSLYRVPLYYIYICTHARATSLPAHAFDIFRINLNKLIYWRLRKILIAQSVWAIRAIGKNHRRTHMRQVHSSASTGASACVRVNEALRLARLRDK